MMNLPIVPYALIRKQKWADAQRRLRQQDATIALQVERIANLKADLIRRRHGVPPWEKPTE